MKETPRPAEDGRLDGAPGRPTAGRFARPLAIAFSLVMTLLVLSPVAQNWRQDPDDGFPLSYYPMFTKVRGETTEITFAETVDGAGEVSRVRYSHIGRGGLNQVRRQIKRLVRRDRADDVCRLAANRLVTRDRYRQAKTLRIVTGEFHISDYMHGSKQPVSRRVRAACSLEEHR